MIEGELVFLLQAIQQLALNVYWQGFLPTAIRFMKLAVKVIYYSTQRLRTSASIAFTALLCPLLCLAQPKNNTTVVAGKEYDRSKLHEWLWGKHYRKEWATPVVVPLLYLDTAAGGLTPISQAEELQAKTLLLQNNAGKEYLLRSINKWYGNTLPPMYEGTFIEAILNDQVSSSHPYSAITVTPMAEVAGVHHTIPQLVYVPLQTKLDSFNYQFGNKLYLLQQRPHGNWEEASNFGKTVNIIGTEEVLEKILGDNDNLVDERAFVRARLFDMFIGDWGRFEGKWKWGLVTTENHNMYEPIPIIREQAYAKFDGAFLKAIMKLSGINYIQNFAGNIKDVKRFNYPARNLDRKFAIEISRDEWISIAKDLQSKLTDEVIESSIRNLPPEVYPLSGEEIIAKLKSRRDHLVDFATKYYNFLAKKVDVVGSDKNEYFEVTRLPDGATQVNVYRVSDSGEKQTSPIFSKVFKKGETKEVRLFGLRGNDVFRLNGEFNGGIKVRVIGGPGKDSVTDASIVATKKHKTEIYDTHDIVINASNKDEVHYTRDTARFGYHYDTYTPDKSGLRPSIFYSNDDKIYVSLGYMVRKNQWRKYPFAYEHGVYVHYSISQGAFSASYKGVVNQIWGKWNLAVNANWDAIRWTNFYGLGNESKFETTNINYYRMRTREYSGSAGLFRNLGKNQFISFTGFYQDVKIINDADRYLSKTIYAADGLYTSKNFVGLQADYNFSHVDHPVLPSRGLDFFATGSAVRNLKSPDSSFASISGSFDAYFPISNTFIFVVRGGAATLAGHPEFYQYNWIGGSQRLRGYRRSRFFGKSAVNNNNELQWVNNVRWKLFNGKAGLLAFYDIGRVWMPGEDSNVWHAGYGGGFLIAPFEKFSLSVTYGVSSEISLFHVRFNKILF
jgi:hypothetical protein